MNCMSIACSAVPTIPRWVASSGTKNEKPMLLLRPPFLLFTHHHPTPHSPIIQKTPAKSWRRFFKLHFRLVCDGRATINRDVCLFTEGCRHVIIASTLAVSRTKRWLFFYDLLASCNCCSRPTTYPTHLAHFSAAEFFRCRQKSVPITLDMATRTFATCATLKMCHSMLWSSALAGSVTRCVF